MLMSREKRFHLGTQLCVSGTDPVEIRGSLVGLTLQGLVKDLFDLPPAFWCHGKLVDEKTMN
jgi:hypothetical protein